MSTQIQILTKTEHRDRALKFNRECNDRCESTVGRPDTVTKSEFNRYEAQQEL